MSTEFAKLPAQLSEVLGKVCADYAKKHRLRSHLFWQDADIWVLFKESMLRAPDIGIMTRRVVVAAYVQPDELRFMPEIFIQKTDSTLALPAEEKERVALVSQLQSLRDKLLKDRPQTEKEIRDNIDVAWKRVRTIRPEFATEPVW